MQASHQKSIIQFQIEYTQFLDLNGKVVAPLPDFALKPNTLIDLYAAMVRTRIFDAKAIALQRTGKLGTYPSTLGQEAVGVGLGAAMQAQDVLCPYYRAVGAQFWRGVRMVEILLYWGGEERGSHFNHPTVQEDFPICVPIASQTLHAVGIGMAFKLRQEARVVVTDIGDGGTSRGDFYEAINLAGVMQLPIVFVINNNQWAISVSRQNQTAAQTLAQKGIAAGIMSEQVDGNDIIAMQYVVQNAVERARQGQGPSVIEAITYRLCDHTTADDANRYRAEAELEKFKLEDPLKRLWLYLIQENLWDETKETALQKRVSDEVADAVAEYEKIPNRAPETMFDHLYSELPEAYKAQREEVSQLKGITSHG